MSNPELSCKKIANKVLWYLSKELRPEQVLFVEERENLCRIEGASTFSISISSPLHVKAAVQEILTKVPQDFHTSIELQIPPRVIGVVVTSCNISIRVLKHHADENFLVTICWK